MHMKWITVPGTPVTWMKVDCPGKITTWSPVVAVSTENGVCNTHGEDRLVPVALGDSFEKQNGGGAVLGMAAPAAAQMPVLQLSASSAVLGISEETARVRV